MRLALFAAFLLCFGSLSPVVADDWVTLGHGRLFTNDKFGDDDDRWRTGSLQFSVLRGREGTIARPANFGEMVEYRFGNALITSSNLTNPGPEDRRYAGLFSLGMHSHFTDGALEFSLGGDLYITGPQTGLGQFHVGVHEALGMVPPSAIALANQIGDGFYPTALVEIARPYQFSGKLALRPYLETQAGIESYARIGVDMLIGSKWQQGVFLRDITTGILYQATSGTPAPGFSMLIGGDMAHVFGSALLPAADGYQLTGSRNRLRVGVNYQGEKASLFYGLTWLGREFEAQPEGQVVGSLRIGISF